MAKIYKMSAHLADLIAAGEVVERPGSVVKELVENAIDAGAESITVEIRGGGMRLIRVTDNGCGMSEEDAKTAFLRHATSKLRDERGLEAIGTLGFRGEALAAIAAVSRVELTTKEKDAGEGNKVTLEGGTVTMSAPTGAPDGTTIIVRDLFYNTPARLKFMKNDRAEGANVTTVIVRMALSHPEVSIRYIKDGKEEYHTPGDGRIESAVYTTLGREFSKDLLKAESDDGYAKVTGFISSPASCRGNRSWQFFFLNGRFIKSKLLQAALEQAYKNSLFTGRFPVCVLNIKMPFAAVDVNVHPAKLEVRFVEEKRVFDAVYWAVRGALQNDERTCSINVSDGTKTIVDSSTGEVTSFSEDRKPQAPIKQHSSSNYISPQSGIRSVYRAQSSFAAVVLPKDERKTDSVRDFLRKDTFSSYQTTMNLPHRAEQVMKTGKTEEKELEYDFHYIGEAMNTYLIAQKGDSIFLIDKHAAHERMLFDRLKKNTGAPLTQLLMTPIIVNIGDDDVGVLTENTALLSEFGFEIDDFGGGSAAIRALPADIDMGDPAAFLEEIADDLRTGGRQGLDAMRDGVMHSVACKAAIKAGTGSEPESVMALIKKVLDGEVKYCPHGRPVAMEITKAQLDRSFKRT